MADLGSLFYSLYLKDMTDSDIDKVRKKLESMNVSMNLGIDANKIDAAIKGILAQRSYSVNIAPASMGGKGVVPIDVDKQTLRKSIEDALKGNTYEAKVKLVVDKAQVSDAIKQAFAKAGVQYNTTASDVRQQRILDIQARMAERAALAQQRLTNAQEAGARAAQRNNSSISSLNSSLTHQDRILSGLKDQIANVYSIYTLERFATQLVEIGGEFQKQRIALQAILGSASKADAIYAKIKDLAIESPFNFKELMGYTKQLSAFSIPYNELYETTKRLADISSGLGVDMGRIILAYGQVRSAAFLRGQEVRQFTEAGIPLLDELAKKFSLLENRVVSVGEVFDKISQREVPFQMVKDVLWDLTNEGGKFYNMQEVLTESLSGKLAKLKDSYEIMLSEVAQANNKVLEGGLDALTSLTSDWNVLVNTIQSLITAYGTYKAVMLTVNALTAKSIVSHYGLSAAAGMASQRLAGEAAAMGMMNVQTAGMVTRINSLKTAFASLGTAGWAGIILSALIAVGVYIYNAYQYANRLKNELDDIANRSVVSAQNEIDGYSILVEKLRGVVKGSQEYNDIIDKIQTRYGAYLGNIEAEAKAYEYLHGKINEVTAALRAKAMESAREQGVSKITEKYTENKADTYKQFVSSLQRNFRISKEFASQIASVIQSDISKGMDAALFREYDKALDYIKNKASELGMALNEPISSGNLGSIYFLRRLNFLNVQENTELSEFDNTLKAVMGTTTAYGIQIEKLEKAYEEEAKSIPVEATSRLRTAYLKLLEAKKAVYKSFGQEDEARRMDVEIANVTRLEAEWRSLSKEKFSGYNYLFAKEDESEIDYVERLKKELASLEDISTKIGTMSPETISKAKEKANLIREYLSYYGISAKGNKTEEKEEKERRNALEKIFESLLSIRMENEENEIKLMEDGTEKKLRQIDADYEKQKQEIAKKARELAKENKKAGISGVGSSGLTEEQQKEVDKAIKLNSDKRIKLDKEVYKAEADAMRDYLKEYGTFQQQKLAIAEEYSEKIRKAQSEGERLTLEKQKNAALQQVEIKAIKQSIDWGSVFGEFGAIFKDQLQPTINKLKNIAESDEFKSSSLQDQQALYELITKLEQSNTVWNSDIFQKVSDDMMAYQTAIQNHLKAQERERLATEALAKAKRNLASAEQSGNGVESLKAQSEVAKAQFALNLATQDVQDFGAQVQETTSDLQASSTLAVNMFQNLESGLNGLTSGSLQGIGKGLMQLDKLFNNGGITKDVGNALASGFQSLLGKDSKASKAITEALGSAGMAGEIISAILGVLDVIAKDGLSGIITGLQDTILGAAEKMLDDLLSGDIIVKPIKNALGHVGNIVNTLTFGGFNSIFGSNAKEVAETTNRLTESNERLKSSVDSLKDEMSKTGGWKAIDAAKQAEEDQKVINKQTLDILRTQMGYHGAHHSNAYYWGLGSEDYASLNKTLADYAKKNGKYECPQISN